EAQRDEFRRRLDAAQRTACGVGDEIETVRLAKIARETVVWKLLVWGFVVVRNHGGSVYLDRDGFTVRVSDHEIPESSDRRGRKSWCRSRGQLIVGVGTRGKAIERWFTRVALEAGKVAA